MVGKDGGITEGDAHLTNYRENAKFFLDPFNPANFEVVWNSASTIYKSLGTINNTVPSAKIKDTQILAGLSEAYKDVKDLSQPTFKPEALKNMTAEAGSGQVLTKAVMISFEPNKSVLNQEYDTTIPATLEEIGKLAGKFGNAYIIIEGNTDASRKGIVPSDLVRQLSYDRADCRAQVHHGKIQVRSRTNSRSWAMAGIIRCPTAPTPATPSTTRRTAASKSKSSRWKRGHERRPDTPAIWSAVASGARHRFG